MNLRGSSIAVLLAAGALPGGLPERRQPPGAVAEPSERSASFLALTTP